MQFRVVCIGCGLFFFFGCCYSKFKFKNILLDLPLFRDSYS